MKGFMQKNTFTSLIVAHLEAQKKTRKKCGKVSDKSCYKFRLRKHFKLLLPNNLFKRK